MEDPLQRAGAHVVGVDVGRRRGVAGAAGRQRHDDEVLEDPARVVGLQRADRRDVAVEADAQVDAAIGAEARIVSPVFASIAVRMPGVDVEQPLLAAVGAAPVVHAARADGAFVGVRPAARGPSRRRARRSSGPSRARTSCRRRQRIEEVVLVGRIRPRDFELADVALVDLRERRVLRRVGAAEVLVPAFEVELAGGSRGRNRTRPFPRTMASRRSSQARAATRQDVICRSASR